MPDTGAQEEHPLLISVCVLHARYSSLLFTLHASCRSLFVSCQKADEMMLENLQTRITSTTTRTVVVSFTMLFLQSRTKSMLREVLLQTMKRDKCLLLINFLTIQELLNAVPQNQINLQLKLLSETRSSLGNTTPKLHLFEQHTIHCMWRFGVSLGPMGEQGGESIHN